MSLETNMPRLIRVRVFENRLEYCCVEYFGEFLNASFLTESVHSKHLNTIEKFVYKMLGKHVTSRFLGAFYRSR